MNKKIFVIISTLIVVLSLISCATNAKTVTSTKDNVGYLQFVTKNGKEAVSVIVDNEIAIVAETCNSTKAVRNENTYAISPGSHAISVSYNGNEVLNKTVFISAQNVNVVELPL